MYPKQFLKKLADSDSYVFYENAFSFKNFWFLFPIICKIFVIYTIFGNSLSCLEIKKKRPIFLKIINPKNRTYHHL